MNTLIKDLKAAGQDFELYPTTEEILTALSSHFGRIGTRSYHSYSVLDIGAGTGKALQFFKEKCFTYFGEEKRPLFSSFTAIEKSLILQEKYEKEIYVAGTDFWDQSLIGKDYDMIFCNPPYSEFKDWVKKIIDEIEPETTLYLVIPQRWKEDKEIKELLAARKAKPEVVGSFDFMESKDRKARAKVDLVCIHFSRGEESFSRFFDKEFSSIGEGEPESDFARYGAAYEEAIGKERAAREQKIQSEIVKGRNLAQVLTALYNDEMSLLFSNFKKIGELSTQVLKCIEVDKSKILTKLKELSEEKKRRYWNELFTNMKEINSRMTSESRKLMQDRLHSRTNIEFNEGNIYSVVIWSIKHANSFLESQLINEYGKLHTFANTENYKSNHRVFTQEHFRYCAKPSERTHYKLRTGTRLVIESWAKGICEGGYRSYDSVNGLKRGGAKYLDDLCTIAHNLGFEVEDRASSFHWEANKPNIFTYKGGKTFMKVRAFMNGNLHLWFDPEFIGAWNVEHGRLKGWIRTKAEAVEELGENPRLVEKYFSSHAGIKLRSMGNLLPAPEEGEEEPQEQPAAAPEVTQDKVKPAPPRKPRKKPPPRVKSTVTESDLLDMVGSML